MASLSLRRILLNAKRVLNSTPSLPSNSLRVLSSNPISRHSSSSSVFPFTSQSSNDSPSRIDLSNEENKKRLFNRLVYRSKQRGLLELDLILGRWVEDNIHSLDENRIQDLIHVLDLENPDLWNWLSGQEQPPESISANPVFAAVRESVVKSLDSHSAPETRAAPGQPWIRVKWGDSKRAQYGPIAGNQQ